MKIFLVTRDPTLFERLQSALGSTYELHSLQYPEQVPSVIGKQGNPDLVLFDQPPEEDNLDLKFYAAAKELTDAGHKVVLLVRYFNPGTQVAALVNASACCVPRSLPPNQLLQAVESELQVEPATDGEQWMEEQRQALNLPGLEPMR